MMTPEGVVRLTCVGQQELEAECAFTLRQLHSAIRSPPRLVAIVTHPRIYAPPTPLARALDQVGAAV